MTTGREHERGLEHERRHERQPGGQQQEQLEREPKVAQPHDDIEHHEALPRDGPRIYVASLSDYNAGVLHGEWIEASANVETMQDAIGSMLRNSPTAKEEGLPAEEWAIHDFEGFGALRLGEMESLEWIAVLARGIELYGAAFTGWLDATGERGADAVENFEERLQGRWESVEVYAEQMLDDLGATKFIEDAPEWLQSYLTLDVAGFARDLELGGDIGVVEADDEDGGVGVWVFWA